MANIKCTACSKEVHKFDYELKLINIDSYCCKECRIKNCREERVCPVCNKNFITLKREDKKTCSYSCSNKFFRTGENNGNWKENTYRTTCFSKHAKKCVVCGEENIVEVHHYDNNHKNNKIENLIPICPTHHKYIHSRYSDMVIPIIEKYRKAFLKKTI